MADLSQARQFAREGYGYENLMVKLGLSEDDARYIVFGRDAFLRWKAKEVYRWRKAKQAEVA